MTKVSIAVQELSKMNATELEDHLRAQRRQLFTIRFQQATGQVENHRQLRNLRKEIARTMTLQIEQRWAETSISEKSSSSSSKKAKPKSGQEQKQEEAK